MGSTVQAMQLQAQELRERAAASAAALRALVAQGEEVEALVQRKRSLKPLVVELRSEAETLTRRLRDSSTVVQGVVESVRVLDTAQANTRKALERTVDIVGLKSCVEEVAAAMQAENWEKAADVMQHHLRVVPPDSDTGGEEVAMQALRRSHAELQRIITDRCQTAADAGDQEAVQRFAKVMTKIGLGEQGLLRFTEFIAIRVETDAARQVEGLKSVVGMGAEGSNVALFAQCLTKVLEIVAKAVDEAEQLIGQKNANLESASAGGYSASPAARRRDSMPAFCRLSPWRPCACLMCGVWLTAGEGGIGGGQRSRTPWRRSTPRPRPRSPTCSACCTRGSASARSLASMATTRASRTRWLLSSTSFSRRCRCASRSAALAPPSPPGPRLPSPSPPPFSLRTLSPSRHASCALCSAVCATAAGG